MDREQIEKLEREIEELKEALSAKEALEGVYKARLSTVEEIRQMKLAKVFRTASIRMGKGDPFDAVVRELKPQECIRVWIGEYIYKEAYTEIRGWAADPAGPDEYLRVRAADGSIVPARITRHVRADVNSTLGLPKERKTGFILKMPREACGKVSVSGPFVLEAEGVSGISRMPLRIEISREKRLRIWREALEKGEAPADGPLIAYDDWAYANRPAKEELARQREEHFQNGPLVSIVVPLFETPEAFLKELLDSVLAQTYARWELCLADGSPDEGLSGKILEIAGEDPRIRYRHLEANEGISGNTNAAVSMAEGEWIVFMDHDDVLTPDALYEVVKLINGAGCEETDLIYSDEDKLTKDGSYLYDPFFKPDFDPFLLTSYNYFTHLVAVRAETLKKAGALDSRYDGAQDYDEVLRLSETARRVGHVAKSLYHWRAHELSTAGNPESKSYAYENGRQALEAHLLRKGLSGEVRLSRYTGRYELRYDVPEGLALSVVLVPEAGCAAKEPAKDLREAFPEGTELIAADARTCGLPAALNEAAGKASGSHILFLSDAVRKVSEEFAALLAGYFQRKDVGAAGGRIVSDNGRISSVGYLLGKDGIPMPAFRDLSTEVFGYGGYANLAHTVSGLSAECLLTERARFLSMGGFDGRFEKALFDLDYCLRLRDEGLYTVVCPEAEVTLSGADTGPDAAAFTDADRVFFSEIRGGSIPAYDPLIGPNLAPNRSDFALKGQYL